MADQVGAVGAAARAAETGSDKAGPAAKPVGKADEPSADALLREAVRGAKPRSEAPEPRRPPASLRARARLGAGIAAGLAVGVLLGGGALAAWHHLDRVDQHRVTAAEWKRIAARLETRDEAGRQGADLKALKDQLALVREQQERSRADSAARAAGVTDRLDRMQRADHETADRIVALTDRLERADKEGGVRLAALAERLEKRLPVAVPPPAAATPAPAKPVAAADPADRTGSIPDAKSKTSTATPAAPATLDAWVLRDVFDGVAIVEGRNQRLVEVAPGESLPGGGRVEAIERRGRAWVVVTSKGLITARAR